MESSCNLVSYNKYQQKPRYAKLSAVKKISYRYQQKIGQENKNYTINLKFKFCMYVCMYVYIYKAAKMTDDSKIFVKAKLLKYS